MSPSIDAAMEYLPLEMDLKRKPVSQARGGAVGLGYRVPLVVASPWSRGGAVNSQVLDHTSILMFLEKFLSKKTATHEETTLAHGGVLCVVTSHRCQTLQWEKSDSSGIRRKIIFTTRHKAQFKDLPVMPSPVQSVQIDRAKEGTLPSNMPQQEKGSRVSNALPYELYVTGKLSEDRLSFRFQFEAKKAVFGEMSAGAPFNVYAMSNEWATR